MAREQSQKINPKIESSPLSFLSPLPPFSLSLLLLSPFPSLFSSPPHPIPPPGTNG